MIIVIPKSEDSEYLLQGSESLCCTNIISFFGRDVQGTGHLALDQSPGSCNKTIKPSFSKGKSCIFQLNTARDKKTPTHKNVIVTKSKNVVFS